MHLISSFLQYCLQSVTSEGLYGLMYRTVSIVLNGRNSDRGHTSHTFCCGSVSGHTSDFSPLPAGTVGGGPISEER